MAKLDTLEVVLKDKEFKKKLESIQYTTNEEIKNTFSEFSKEDLANLEETINDNKMKAGESQKNQGIPDGNIKFLNYDIPIRTIFDNFNHLEENYNEALKPENNSNKENLLKCANKKLMDCILLLIKSVWEKENSLSINHQKSDLESFEVNEFMGKLVSRDHIADQISKIGPSLEGSITLKDGITIPLSDEKFSSIISNFKSKYSKTKSEDSLKRLDTQLAEQLILAAGYYIQINNPLLTLQDSNYKSKNVLSGNLTRCQKGLEKIGITTDAVRLNYNGEFHYVIRPKEVPTIIEKNEEESSIIASFCDAMPAEFKKFCDEQGIKREDGQEIDGRRGLDPNVKYVDKDGNIYVLKWHDGASIEDSNGQYDDEGGATWYDLILEKKVSPKPEPKPKPVPVPPKPEPEPDPKPVPVPPKPEPEPDPKPVPVPPKPEPEPDPKPVPVPPKPEPEPDPKPVPVPPKPEPEPNNPFNLDVVLSDVTESYDDMISREVENKLDEDWHNTSRWNFRKRGKLWLVRGKMRKKMIAKKKEEYEKGPFTRYKNINDEMSKQASRHDLEEGLGDRKAFGKIDRETLHLSEDEQNKINTLAKDYVQGNISKAEFQDRFNDFTKDLPLPIDKKGKFFATNILDKLDDIKSDNELLNRISNELTNYVNDHNQSHFDNIRKEIDNNFKSMKRDSRFRENILSLIDSTGLTKEELDKKINQFIRHEKTLAKMSANNLQLKLDLLVGGKGAYQTNNKDRENWLFRFGNKMDKMPWRGQALTVIGISASGLAVAALGGSALAATATLSGLVGAKNFIKKWTHHTKEQNTYEKNLTRNYEEEIAKMKKWEEIRNAKDDNGKHEYGWIARHRAKRELGLYQKTTQEALQNQNEGNTRQIAEMLYNGINNYDKMASEEKKAFHSCLLDAQARLETYRKIGHNFLKSNNQNEIEQDFFNLENALNICAKRICGGNASLLDLSRTIDAYDEDTLEKISYKKILDGYEKDYNQASNRFKKSRAIVATAGGLKTAAVTFGTSVLFQKIAGTGIFAKEAVSGTPSSIETTNTVADYFGSGQYEMVDGNHIFSAAQENISSLNPSDSVTLHLGAGTNGDPVRAGSKLLYQSTYDAKLQQVTDIINHSSISNKSELIDQINNGFGNTGFTNANLHGMRCLETIEETVKGSGDFGGTLNISYDTPLDVDSHVLHEASSRVGNAFLEITKAGTDGTPGGNKRLVLGLPVFSNLFKRDPDKVEPKGGKHDGDKKEQNRKSEDIKSSNGDEANAGKVNTQPDDTGNTSNTAHINSTPEKQPTGGNNETGTNTGSPIVQENTVTQIEISEQLKKEISDDIKRIYVNDIDSDDFEYGELDFKKQYKDNELALKSLEDVKNFWKSFPSINFYNKEEIKKLKEKYKDNLYILEKIYHETQNTDLDAKFKHFLKPNEIESFHDKAVGLIDDALKNGNIRKYGNRPVVVIKISDELTIPFYRSTGEGGKRGVPSGKFYPFFGIDKSGWLNKSIESEINNFYGSPLLAAIAHELNKRNDNDELHIEDWGFTNEDFNKKINLGKQTVDIKSNVYGNINKTLNTISAIKAKD